MVLIFEKVGLQTSEANKINGFQPSVYVENEEISTLNIKCNQGGDRIPGQEDVTYGMWVMQGRTITGLLGISTLEHPQHITGGTI